MWLRLPDRDEAAINRAIVGGGLLARVNPIVSLAALLQPPESPPLLFIRASGCLPEEPRRFVLRHRRRGSSRPSRREIAARAGVAASAEGLRCALRVALWWSACLRVWNTVLIMGRGDKRPPHRSQQREKSHFASATTGNSVFCHFVIWKTGNGTDVTF